MDTKAAPNRWFNGWRFADRSRREDPADLGTAFGLDMSLDPSWAEPEPAAPPASRTPSWVQRLTACRRPATRRG
jgi:hypothetical protein